jgi:uncharacterized DUF497 family protein
MEYQWDPDKARRNYKIHDIRFSDAITVFVDDRALTIEDDHPDERRYVTLGMDATARLLAVVYTWRGDDIRIISARKATKNEIKQYGE